MNERFVIAEPVAAALASGRAVVALETTVVTHGLPDPDGVNTAIELEDEISARGAVPATIGVLDGRIRVGITRAELERLAHEAGARASDRAPTRTKLNLSNLAARLASGEPGSTTVAATAFAAARVGIEVFATGGIGGVHRDAGESGDISADLLALSRYPVAVVCAGAKAVLDLSRTVEMLETLGVPVLGFGTDEFPAFYRRSSGLKTDARFDSAAEMAAAIRAHFALELGGVVVANPIPEEHEMPLELYEHALAAALSDTARDTIRGRDVTPFLLERLRDFTASESVFSNRALLVNNARLAADLAKELAGTRGRK